MGRRALGELNKEWVKYWVEWVGKQEEGTGGEWTLGDLLLWGSASLVLGHRLPQELRGWWGSRVRAPPTPKRNGPWEI